MDLQLPISQDDIDKINALIEKAYHAGYEMGKQDERRNSETLRELQETIKRQEQTVTLPSDWYSVRTFPLDTRPMSSGSGGGAGITVNGVPILKS